MALPCCHHGWGVYWLGAVKQCLLEVLVVGGVTQVVYHCCLSVVICHIADSDVISLHTVPREWSKTKVLIATGRHS